MASSTLDRIPAGSGVFVDSTIFIYHFTGASSDCRDFLARCEGGELRGMTSVVVLAETAHRLMMVEAVVRGLITPGNVAKKLRARPAIVRRLTAYRDQIERIPLMGIDVAPLELGTLLRSADLRQRHGLLTNDSLVVAAAAEGGVGALASADRDFGRVPELKVYRPADLSQQ